MSLMARHHHDKEAARDYLEKLLWPDGPVCPKCGLIDEAYHLNGETTREGLYKCAGCRAPFTVTMGTIFEDSHIPLHKWLLAIYLMCSSKKGISAHQLWRNLWGVDEETGKQKGSYKTAWFMAHRIRWALGQEPMLSKVAGIVEVDETWVGGKLRLGSGRNEKGVSMRAGKDPNANKVAVVSAPAGANTCKSGIQFVSTLQESEAAADHQSWAEHFWSSRMERQFIALT